MSKGEFYRLCRLVHGWLSAFAFLALLFFSATGILLNHPGLLGGELPPPVETPLALAEPERAAIREADDPARALVDLAASRAALTGAFVDGELVGDDVFVRLQGAKGVTDIRASLATGEGVITVESEPPLRVLNNLHRAEHAGPAWRFFVDAIAVVLIVLSLVGYIIFLSLRFRLTTALALTAASLILMGGLFVLAVP
jgi:hypothetical protein